MIKRPTTYKGFPAHNSGTWGLIRKITALMAILFLSGCASADRPVNPFYKKFVETIERERRDPVRYYASDYDEVWRAAIEALQEYGYIIGFMNKEDGYISADAQGGTSRRRAGIRLSRQDGLVRVSVNASEEYFVQDEKTKTYIWKPSYDVIYNRYVIHKEMALRLSK